MATLLLRLAAPLQAWGTDSKFDYRRTEREPTKSGVIGLLAAALGRGRGDPLEDLKALRFGVRVDREGVLLHDLHTARNAKDAQEGKTTYKTHRYYLSDAVFLAGIEGDEAFLRSLEEALKSPAYPLFLGRRSCPPTLPLLLGIRAGELESVLKNEPPLTDNRAGKRMLLDALPSDRGAVGRKRDLPLSFNPQKREYAYRMAVSKTQPAQTGNAETEHDAMSQL